MSQNFRCEPIEGMEVMKVFSKNNENLPIEFDSNKRFAVLQNWSKEYLQRFEELEVRKDDIWVITEPKSGTTWMLELVWLLKNNFDYETALKIEQEVRVPFLEFCAVIPKEKINSIDVVDKMPSPRIIKSHLPIHLLPKQLWTVKPKIIFVARNPKDVMVSVYHHHRMIGVFRGTIEEYVNLMIDNKTRYTPFGLISLEFWQIRNEPYIFFTSFERMKKDLRSVILGVSKFLERNVDEKQMTKLLDHLSFEKMKANPMCNHISERKKFIDYYPLETFDPNFVRKGAIDSHKTELSEELVERMENWHQKQLESYGVTAEEIFYS